MTLSWSGVLRGDDAAAKDRKKSITIFPIVLNSGAPIPGVSADMSKNIAQVIGLLLERGGMSDIEIAEAAFTPPQNADLDKSAAAFADFVKSQHPGTEYALYGQFTGTPGKGVDEVRIVVADRQGKIILSERRDRQQLAETGEARIDPMSASCQLVKRIRGLWDLAEPNEANAPEGKMAKLWAEKSGTPSNTEMEAMGKRLSVLKQKGTSAKIAVYPIHLWQSADASGAAQLAKLINDSKIFQAEVTDTNPNLKIESNSNEQKVLWDTARALRDFLRKNPPPTDYALLADYGLSPSSDGKQEAVAVHLVLCDKSGDWVLVDFQNDHHEDFESIAPKTIDDCNRLAVLRLKHRLARISHTPIEKGRPSVA